MLPTNDGVPIQAKSTDQAEAGDAVQKSDEPVELAADPAEKPHLEANGRHMSFFVKCKNDLFNCYSTLRASGTVSVELDRMTKHSILYGLEEAKNGNHQFVYGRLRHEVQLDTVYCGIVNSIKLIFTT